MWNHYTGCCGSDKFHYRGMRVLIDQKHEIFTGRKSPQKSMASSVHGLLRNVDNWSGYVGGMWVAFAWHGIHALIRPSTSASVLGSHTFWHSNIFVFTISWCLSWARLRICLAALQQWQDLFHVEVSWHHLRQRAHYSLASGLLEQARVLHGVPLVSISHCQKQRWRQHRSQ